MFFSDDEGKLSEGYKIFSERFGFCPREDIFVRAASENKIEKENGKSRFFIPTGFRFSGRCFVVLPPAEQKFLPRRSKKRESCSTAPETACRAFPF